MGNNFKNLANHLPTKMDNGSIIPSNVSTNLHKLGEKGGEKYSSLVDKVVDFVFKIK